LQERTSGFLGEIRMKILITGSGGFLGSQLMLRLKWLTPVGTTGLDLTKEHDVAWLLHQQKPDIIFHFAGMTNPKKNEEMPKQAFRANVGITRNIIQNTDAHIVFPSTDKVYYGGYPSEETSLNPTGFYGELKAECENIVRTNKHHILRLPIVHSYGNEIAIKKGSFIDEALVKLKNGEEVNAFNNVKRCFINVWDFVEFMDLLRKDENYGTYNCGSKMMSYAERLNGGAISVEGKVTPLEQNLNTDKLKRTFGIRFQ